MTIKTFDFTHPAYGININDQGDVVGVIYNPKLKTYEGFYFSQNQELNLGDFFPVASNKSGQIIGYSLDNKNKTTPILWDNGTIKEISELIEMKADFGISLDSVDRLVGINDQGMIIGTGKINGTPHGFLLIPIK